MDCGEPIIEGLNKEILSCTDTTFNSTCTLRCTVGYDPRAPQDLFCDASGKWVGANGADVFKCVGKCTVKDNGTKAKPAFQHLRFLIPIPISFLPFPPNADQDGCSTSPCATTVSVCEDIPAPQTGYVCHCAPGFSGDDELVAKDGKGCGRSPSPFHASAHFPSPPLCTPLTPTPSPS